jgi:hypothetical protein
MKFSRLSCVSLVAFAGLALLVDAAAAANLCVPSFWKGDVKGSPPAESSSFTCTTKVIMCPPSTTPGVASAMSDLKAMASGSGVVFSYACNYPPPIK